MATVKTETAKSISKMVKTLGWGRTAQMRIQKLRKGRYTGEQIRHRLLAEGLPRPSSPSAWGGVIVAAKRNGILEDTGERVVTKDVTSRGRKTTRYQKV